MPLFRAAIALDGADEMFYHALGQALRDRGRGGDRDGLAVYRAALSSTRAARRATGRWASCTRTAATSLRATPRTRPTRQQFYERAAALRPDEYGADGSRILRVEPNTPEREAARSRGPRAPRGVPAGHEGRHAHRQLRRIGDAEAADPLKKPR